MAFHNSGRIVTSGLVLSLDAADRNSYQSGSTTWFDLSGNNNSGSLVNGPTFSSANGGSIVFDGTNDYINCGSGSSVNITGTQLTLSAWVRRTSTNPTGSFRRIIEKAATYPALQYSFVTTPPSTPPEGRLLLDLYLNSSLPASLTSSTSLQLNTWYYAVATYDGSFRRLYINGFLDGELATTGSITSTTSNLAIGDYLPGAAGLYVWSGSISNVQIYNRALSAQEVRQNYDAMKSRFNLT